MTEKYNPTEDDKIAAMESDAADLLAVIRKFSLDPPRQRRPEDDLLKLKKVIKHFDYAAHEYLETARKLLEKELLNAATDQHQSIIQKYGYAQVKVEHHALKLIELVRSDPAKEYFPSDRRLLFRRLITFVTNRISVKHRISDKPFILPVLGDSFKSVLFNYVDRFGLICLPTRKALKNDSDRYLGIFWHEAAGFAIASARNNNKSKLEKWPETLRELLVRNQYWTLYSDLYRQSLLNNLSGRVEYENAKILTQIEQLISENIFDKNPENVDGDGSWQLTWLSEFLEDLYWVVVGIEDNVPGGLADDVVSVLAGALASSYSDLTVGDPGHPPPHLRILVAIRYLCNGNQDCINERLNKLVAKNEVFEEIFNQDEQFNNMVEVIESVCREILEPKDQDPWLFDTNVLDEERAIANLILKSSDILPNQLPDSVQQDDPVLNQKFMDRIYNAKDLDSLLENDFSTVDPNPYSDRDFQPPPPPPWVYAGHGPV